MSEEIEPSAESDRQAQMFGYELKDLVKRTIGRYPEMRTAHMMGLMMIEILNLYQCLENESDE